MKQYYHYEYFVYTDNLCWGRMLLGRAMTWNEANAIGERAGRGVFVVLKKRVYDS